MGKKAAFHSLGCKVNSYETGTMIRSLLERGYEEVPFAPGADVYIINTCTVTNVADRKSRQMLHKAREMNPGAIVVACGCYAEDAETNLQKDPAVDLIVGNNDKGRLPEILEEYFRDRESAAGSASGKENGKSSESGICAGSINSVKTYEELPFAPAAERTRSFVKIQDGCNQFCSYCMIPYVRGRVRSRKKEEILKEVRKLADEGCREIVLTGIHISSYGLDFLAPGRNLQTPYAENAETNELLLDVIRQCCATEGIRRLRLGSLEPGIMTEDFIRELSEIPELCPAFHLSLQSGSDSVLARMKRRYRTQDYAQKCSLLRTWFDHPAIMTDIITGFPGETEEEFRETEAFVRGIHFSRMHIFKYSVRKGTKAAEMKGQVPEKIKHLRSSVLMDIDEQEREAYAESFLGKTVEVQFEESGTDARGRYLTGYTKEYVPARLYSESISENEICAGRVASAERGTVLLGAGAEMG